MINRYRYIILLVSGLLFFSAPGYSQSAVRRVVDNIVLEAVEKLNQGNVKEAEDYLSDVLAIDPNCDAAWYYMAMVAINKADLDHAMECYTKAVELDSSNFWYRQRLARLAVYHSPEMAIEMFEGLIKDFPKKSQLYMEVLDLYIANQEYEKALQTIFEIEKTIGPTEEFAVYAYRILYTLGREEEGLEHLKQYNTRYSSPAVLTILADAELAMYNDTLAIQYYDEALGLDSSFSHALIGKAEACRMSRRYDEFFPALNRYVENSSSPVAEKKDYLSALIEKSDFQFIRRFIPQLDTTMAKLSQTHPKDSLVYNLKGLYFYYTGRNEASVEQFRECAYTYPESYAAAASYVEFLMYVGKWKELSDEGRNAFNRFPSETAFLEMAGVGDYNLKDYHKVLETCETVLEMAPRDSSKALRSWSTMGDVYHILGDSKKAYKAYEKALKINPDYIYVLNNYAYYLSMDGKNLKKAYQMSKKTVDAEPDNATYLDTFGWILYLRGDLTEAKSFFKTAILHGGKESAVILDHYAEVLFALKEYDLAFVYWNLAMQKNDGDKVPGLKQKVENKKKEIGR